MSDMWNRTLVYLGLREEPEEMYDEAPERSTPEDDPHVEHAPERPRASRTLVGATAAPHNGNGEVRTEAHGTTRHGDDERDRPTRPRSDEQVTTGMTRDRGEPEDSNVRSLRTGDSHVRAVERESAKFARAALVEVEGFEDVESIGSRYRAGQPVLFDIRPGDRASAQRVVDFVSGLTYASHGRLTKVGARAFLLIPEGVWLSEDEQRRLRGLGYRLPAADDA